MHLGKKRPKNGPFTLGGEGGQGEVGAVIPENQVAKHHFASVFEDKDDLRRRKQLLETSKQFYISNL